MQTRVSDQDEFLLRPDLGRLLDRRGHARRSRERCVKKPQVQVVVGDGLSAAAVTNNLPQIYPVIEQGLTQAGLSVGTPFFVRYCRVGVMNDINDIVHADVVVLLIGERPGLGVADAHERLLRVPADRRQDRRAARRDLHDHARTAAPTRSRPVRSSSSTSRPSSQPRPAASSCASKQSGSR